MRALQVAAVEHRRVAVMRAQVLRHPFRLHPPAFGERGVGGSVPHALTDRQRDYLNFIKRYIAQNERSPRLEEVVGYFGVLAALVSKRLTMFFLERIGRQFLIDFYMNLRQLEKKKLVATLLPH